MAVGFRSSGAIGSADGGNLTGLAFATGHQSGDLLFVQTGAFDNVSCTMPAGWTRFSAANNGTTCRQELWWAISTGSGTTITITHSGGSTIAARMFAFTGVDNATPLGSVGGNNNNSGTAGAGTITDLGLTPAGVSSAIVWAVSEVASATDSGGSNFFASWSGTDPTFSNEICDVGAQLTHEADLGTNWGQSISGSSTGTRTVAFSGGSSGAYTAISTMFELIPGAAAAATSIFIPQTRIANRNVGSRSQRHRFHRIQIPTFTVVGGTIFTQTLTANATTTASIQNLVSKLVSATSPTTASFQKQVSKGLSTTAPTTATLLKQVNRTMSATATSTATVQKQANKLMSATATTTAAMQRQANKVLAPVVTTTASIQKRVSKFLTATVPSTASLLAQKVILVALTAGVTTTASILKTVLKPLTATSTTTATIQKQVNKLLTATSVTTASLAAKKVIIVVMTAGVTTAATIQKQVQKLLSATAPTTATTQKQANKPLSATSVASGALQKQINKLLSATATTTATLTSIKVFIVNLTAGVTTTASIQKLVSHAMTALPTVSGVVRKTATKTLTATATTTASLAAVKATFTVSTGRAIKWFLNRTGWY